ncbi:MAG TPA: MMPL family transporter [Polyangia bacterium]|nr:MMPL family transporter [Polyangia bacterium]
MNRLFVRGAARWARWTARRRRPILIAAIAVAAAAGAVARCLPLHGELAALLPPEATSVRDLRALERRAQVFGTIIVAVQSDDPSRRAAAAAQVRRRLEALPRDLILQVDGDSAVRDRYAWEHRYLLASTADLEALRDELRDRKARANPLYVALDDGEPADDGRLRGLAQRVDALRVAAEHPTPLVSRDGSLQIVVARTRYPADDLAHNAPALAAARAAADEARATGTRAGVAGDVITSAEEHRALSGGMLQATLFTTAIVAGGLLLFFGAAAPVLALLGALAVGALVTFAFALAAVGHLNLATAFLAPIVVGNGINFGIILLARHLEERRAGHGPDVALARAVAGSFGGTLAAALTASVSYASLLATQFRGFRHFGVIGGVGILLCWGATFLVLPAAISALEARGWMPAARRERSLAGDGLWLARLLARRALAVVVLVAAIFIGAGAGAVRYLASRPFETDFKNLRSSGAAIREIRAWSATVDGAFGRGISGGTVVALPSVERARDVAARMRASDAGKPDAQRLFARVSSFDELVPADQAAKLDVLRDIRRLLTPATLASMSDGDRALALALKPPADLRPIAAADVPPQLAWPFTEQDGTRGRLLIAKTGPGFDLWRTEDLHRFVACFRALDLGPDVVVGGNAFVQDDIVRTVDRDGPRSTLIAALGAVLVVLAILGAGRAAAVTVACGAAGVCLMLAAAGALGIRINFLDFVALPVTIGIGIDYAVNIAARHRAEGAGAAGRILAATGPAVALCSFTTIVGYASLLLSDNQGIRSFGLSALVGELTCVFAALVLAPALLDLRRPSPVPAAGRPPATTPARAGAITLS